MGNKAKSLGGRLQLVCCQGHLLQEDDCGELRKLVQQDSQAAKGGLPGYVEGEEGEGGWGGRLAAPTPSLCCHLHLLHPSP